MLRAVSNSSNVFILFLVWLNWAKILVWFNVALVFFFFSKFIISPLLQETLSITSHKMQ